MAARFFVNGGIDNNWGSTSNWSTTSGGAGGSAIPTTSDDVTLDTNSPNCIVNVAAVCKTITASTYTHTLTLNNTLGIAPASTNTLTFGASMSLAGSSTLTLTGPTSTTASITTNGLVFSVPVTFRGNSATFTLNDDFNVSGFLTFSSGNITLNTHNINASSGLTVTGGRTLGTATLNATGTGTWSVTSGTVELALNINTLGTITFGTSNPFAYAGPTLTYTAGTVITTGSTLQLGSANQTLNCAGVTWNNVIWNPLSASITLSSDFNVGGNFTWNPSGGNAINGAFNFNVGGNVTLNSGGTLTGTATLVMNGTGTFSYTNTNSIALNVTFAGNITLTGTLHYNTKTLKYSSGTLSASGFTLNITGSTPLDLGGQSIGALTCTVAGTIITLNSDLLVANTFTMTGTNSSPLQIKSNVGGTLRKLTMVTSNTGVTEDVIYTNPTDIDSRDGVAVFYAKGTLSNTFNWIGTNPGVAKSGGVLVIGGGTTKLSPSGFTGGVFGS